MFLFFFCSVRGKFSLSGKSPLAISNCYSYITKPKTHYGPDLHHELEGGISQRINDAIKGVADFITERENPYEILVATSLHNYTSRQVVEKDTSKLLKFFEHASQRYQSFRTDRFVKKSKKLSETITKVMLPKFVGKQ